MDSSLNNLLLLHNDITVEIDFETKTILKAYKANRLFAENTTIQKFTDLFCQEEHLKKEISERLFLFFTNLIPSADPFSLMVSFQKETSQMEEQSIQYEIRGIFQKEKLLMTFSNLEKIHLDSLDYITKVYTREAIIEKTKKKINDKKPFALVILDIDNFKQFNDTYGHMFGDIILVETVAAIKKILGPDDFIGRIGGDEFLMVIHTPNNSFDEIHKVCSNIKRTIQELSYHNIKQASVTATLGCSVFPADGDTYELLFKKADKALYRGKKKGRNCFIIYTLEKCGKVDDFSLEESFSDIENIDKNASNSQVIVAVYEILSRNNAIKKNLRDVMSLVGNFFLIERIHLSLLNLINEKNVYIEWIDPRQKEYANLIHPKIENHDLWADQLDQTGMIKLNQVKSQQKDSPFMKLLMEQKTKSILGFHLNFMNKEIGFIRFDTITTNKFWQAPDVSALMVISKIIGITINKLNEQAALEKYMYYDSLTGLFNYTKFRDEFTNKMLDKQMPYAILYFNIQNFSQINNTYGTTIGDNILLLVSKAIQTNIKNGLVCRDADDRFLVYLEDTHKLSLIQYYNHIVSYVHKSIASNVKLNLLCGIYIAGKEEALNDAVDKAMAALRAATQEEHCVFFNHELEKKYQNECAIKNHFYTALEENEFQLYLQPKVEIKTRKLYGAEALSRWNFMNETLLSPSSYISILEQEGYINQLDYFMFEEVCQFLADMKKDNMEPICISVNISRYQTDFNQYIQNIEKIRKKYDIAAEYIEIEVTEGMYIDNISKIAEFVHKLHKLGYYVSMDDFGSGYSNLASLAQLNFDTIKLDRSLCMNESKNKDKPILNFIKELTNSLNVNVLCEGVETEQIAKLLDSLGYRLGQGFLYDQPLPAKDFKKKYILKKA